MTSYLLQNHPFSSTAQGRWTKRTNEGVIKYITDNGRGTRKHLEFSTLAIIDDTASIKKRFQTILGVGDPRWPGVDMMHISFRCLDPLVTSTGNRNNGSIDPTGSAGTVISHSTVSVRVVGIALDNLLVLNKALKLKLEAILEIPDSGGATTTLATGELSAKHIAYRNTFKFEQTVVTENPVDFYKHRNKVWQGKVTVQLIPGEGGGGPLSGLAPAVNPSGRKALEENLFSDFIITCQNGDFIPVHKLFLANQSPVFQRMLESDCQETRENICELDNTKKGVMAFLKFLYYSDIEDPLRDEKVALELLELGHKYEISSLENVMKAMFLSVECYSVDLAVTLFLHSERVAGYEDLKAKAVRSIKLRKDDLMQSTVLAELMRRDPEKVILLFSLALSND